MRVVSEVDLGAYVNLATSKPQLLRIHSIQQQICDTTGLPPAINAATSSTIEVNAFLATAIATKETTLGTGAMPQLNDDSIIYSSAINCTTQTRQSNNQGIVSGDLDLAPQDIKGGILVGVDTLYLYALADDAFAENVNVNFCLECSVEPVSREAAINLALSQS